MNKICPYCKKEFQDINPKVFANHVRWCDKNPNRDKISGSEYRKKLSESSLRSIEQKYGKIIPHKVQCHNCGKEFQVFEREKQFPLKEKYFCSRSCSNTRIHNDECKKKISDAVKQYFLTNGYRVHYKNHPQDDFIKVILPEQEVVRICPNCKTEFLVRSSSKKKFCSISCGAQYRESMRYNNLIDKCEDERQKEKLMFRKYRKECSFKFSLNDFPEEFDFDLIRKYGWYKAKNHGNNLTGVSRDHMYSVMDGFINHVDPKIISHPANCRLMIQNENSSKHNHSSITLDELLKRIELWNSKYHLD